jgi:hypothetical protein
MGPFLPEGKNWDAFQAWVKACLFFAYNFPISKPKPSLFERSSKATHLAVGKMPLGLGC